jgi:hypothetical protein
MEKQPKSIEDHGKEEEDQQDGDENEERRRKTNEEAHAMDYKFKKQCIVNLPKKKEGNEM